jgi:predicted RNA binding protein with dsRBD fold (UPF0201 family)
MNIIEAAKAAGWHADVLAMLEGTEDVKRLERLYNIIRNQALEDAAKCCDGLQDVPATEPRHCAEDIRAMKEQQ